MFSACHKAAQAIIADRDLAEGEAPNILRQALPATYSLQDLHENLDRDSLVKKEEVLELILILHGSLENCSRLSRQDNDEEYITKLTAWVAQSVLPDPTIVSRSDISSENESATITHALDTTKRVGYHGLECLRILQTLPSESTPTKASPESMLSCVVYSSRDPWVGSSVSKIATNHISKHKERIYSREFIVDFLLQAFIRPIFSSSRPSTITSTGRKAMPSSAPVKSLDVGAERRNKPWKYDTVYAVTVLEWAVLNSTEEIISQSWNLFIPPLLTLLDETDTSIRTRGLTILTAFLPKFSTKLLAQTGLGPVFEDAIYPTLMFLPSLTPVEESLQLLPAAYNALGSLCDARFPAPGDLERLKFLDRIIRHGVLPGYLHSSQIPALVEVLINELSLTVSRMGIHFVKHLKDILPVISTILEDPFTIPEQLHATIKTLEAILINAWPRISEPVHYMVILKSLVICWTNLRDQKERRVKDDLKKVSLLLVNVVSTENNEVITHQVDALVAAHPTLNELFSS